VNEISCIELGAKPFELFIILLGLSTIVSGADKQNNAVTNVGA